VFSWARSPCRRARRALPVVRRRRRHRHRRGALRGRGLGHPQHRNTLPSGAAAVSLREMGARFARFNAVGAMGVAVQLGTLALLTRVLGWDYLVATAIAVEAAVAHNFLWHERYTWADRTRGSHTAVAI